MELDFNNTKMNESQVAEIKELMSGEHAKTLEMWYDEDVGAAGLGGLTVGVVATLGVVLGSVATVKLAKATWGLAKDFGTLFMTLCKGPTE